MIGRPKFKEGDRVQFMLDRVDSVIYAISGEVYIVDAYGTFEQNEEPSYDVMADWNGEQTLFKHIRESKLRRLE